MQAALEIGCLKDLRELEAAEPPDEAAEKRWLTALPLVYGDGASLFFEEQLVLSLGAISAMVARAEPARNLWAVRARVCEMQLQERATTVLHDLQSLQFAVSRCT